MHLRSLLAVAILLPVSFVAQAQTPATAAAASAPLEFEVASVKQNVLNDQPRSNFPLGPGDVYGATGGLFSAHNQTIALYIGFAYKLPTDQIERMLPQLPGWALQNRYDIQAKASTPEPAKDEMRAMMKQLLAERFQLALHYEQKEIPVFALTAATPGKTGPMLRPHPTAESCPDAGERQADPFSTAAEDDRFPVRCGGILLMKPSVPERVRVGARNAPISVLTNALPGFGDLGRPVVDQTGLTGNYDFSLEFTLDGRKPSTDAPDAPGAGVIENRVDLLTALKEQLGLKLASQKAVMPVIVIDKLQPPSDN